MNVSRMHETDVMLGGSDLYTTQGSIRLLDDYARESNVVAEEGPHEHNMHDKEATNEVLDLNFMNETM